MGLMNQWTGNLQLKLRVLRAKELRVNGEIPSLFIIAKGGDM